MSVRTIRLILAALLVGVLLGAVAMWIFMPADPIYPGVTLEAVITNETSQPLSGFALVDAQGGRSEVPTIAPAATAHVMLRNPDAHSENSIQLIDSEGVRHLIVGYFEYNMSGAAIVTITSLDSGELSVVSIEDIRTSFEPAPE